MSCVSTLLHHDPGNCFVQIVHGRRGRPRSDDSGTARTPFLFHKDLQWIQILCHSSSFVKGTMAVLARMGGREYDYSMYKKRKVAMKKQRKKSGKKIATVRYR